MTGNPAPPADGAPLVGERVTWGDMLIVLEAEAQRHEIWRDALQRDLAGGNLSSVERETVQGAVRRHAREASAFDAARRIIIRVRNDDELLARILEIDAAERAASAADEDAQGEL